MMRRAIHATVVAAACLGAAGCSPAPTGATNALLAFTPGPAPTVYTGAIVDSTNGSGTVTVALTNAAGLTSGTWQMSFGGKADPEYFVSGTLSGNTYSANVTTCVDTGGGYVCVTDCAFSFAGTLTSASLIGTYAATSNRSCPGQTGSINAAKR